jgi:DNA-directed RNA polymerase specialized sigma24 family protein
MPAISSTDDLDRARRFRDAALPYLDDVYTLARYLLRNQADAEDAVQECYLRALKHFDGYRGPAMKPGLFAILRNVCRLSCCAGRCYAPTPDRPPNCGKTADSLAHLVRRASRLTGQGSSWQDIAPRGARSLDKGPVTIERLWNVGSCCEPA